MGAYDNICELRGIAKEGQGCSKYENLAHCAKRSKFQRHGMCTGNRFDSIVDPAVVDPAPPAPVGADVIAATIMGNTRFPDSTLSGIGNSWAMELKYTDDGVSILDPNKVVLEFPDGTSMRGRKIVRQQYPNNAAGKQDSTVGLGQQRTTYISWPRRTYVNQNPICRVEDGFYGSLRSGVVTNFVNASARAYPRGNCVWLTEQENRQTGNFDVEIAVFHRLRRIVKCEIYAKDGSGNSSPVVTINTPVGVRRPLSTFITMGGKQECYKATINTAALNDGMISVHARCTDDMGNVVIDTEVGGAVWPPAANASHSGYTALRVKLDKSGNDKGADAWVQLGASGGAVGSAATPFGTPLAARQAIQAWNLANKGRGNTGSSRMYLMDDGAGGAVTHTYASDTTGVAGDCWLEILPAPTNTGPVYLSPTANASGTPIPSKIKFWVPVVIPTGSVAIFNGANVAGGMWSFRGGITYAAGAANYPVTYKMDIVFMFNMTVSGISATAQSPFVSFANERGYTAVAAGVVCTDASVNFVVAPYNLVACTFSRAFLFENAVSSNGWGRPNAGYFIANVTMMDVRATSILASLWDNDEVSVLANLLHEGTAAGIPHMRIGGDSSAKRIGDTTLAYCNILNRFNRGYTDVDAAININKSIHHVHSIWGIGAIKSDNFVNPPNSPGRTGNWDTRYFVDSFGNVSRNLPSDSTLNANVNVVGGGSTQWLGDDFYGTYNATVTFVNDKSSTGNGADPAGAGNGDYHLVGAEGTNGAYNQVAVDRVLMDYDLDGYPRLINGKGAAGPFERRDI